LLPKILLRYNLPTGLPPILGPVSMLVKMIFDTLFLNCLATHKSL